MSIRFSAALRAMTLCAVLGVAAIVVPDAAPEASPAALVKVDEASGVDLGSGVVWILAVGSDARPGDDVLRSRGDALQMIALDTRTGAASAIGIPRDSYVAIPGHGRSKINAALTYGGPQGMAGAINNLLGVKPDYVFVGSFEALTALVNGIGGITVRSEFSFSDPKVGPGDFTVGRNNLNGDEALTFARSRHYLPGGDFDRSANQQRVLRGIVNKVVARADEPGFVEEGVWSAMQHLHSNIGPVELFKLGQAVARVDPNSVTTCVLPGGVGYAGSASVVFPDVAKAHAYVAEARQDGTIEDC